jgi:Domain of unknown function (DUF3598)
MIRHAMLLSFASLALGFTANQLQRGTKLARGLTSLHLLQPNDLTEEDDIEIQWDLFKRHHAKGSWKGVWTSYDYIGDVIDETIASVDLNLKDDGQSIEHTHTIVVGAKRSDCATCFDSMETKTLPIAQYTPSNLRKCRLAAVSMVNGPSLLRSGAMATELVLAHGDGRVRVLLQHAPVWEKGVEPGSCPPQGLKLFRCLVSREALRPTAPTAETEAGSPPAKGNPVFFRPVPPFDWHKKWGGTSWTWGPNTGNRGWSLEEMEETDAWHGITPVETWNLRLPGGVFVQAPRVVTNSVAGICRLAWLPDDENLLRVEASVMALRPMLLDDDTMVGFEPPSLASLRCDMMKKLGELENVMRPSRDWKIEEDDDKTEVATTRTATKIEATPSEKISAKEKSFVHSKPGDADDESGLQIIRDTLSF